MGVPPDFCLHHLTFLPADNIADPVATSQDDKTTRNVPPYSLPGPGDLYLPVLVPS